MSNIEKTVIRSRRKLTELLRSGKFNQAQRLRTKIIHRSKPLRKESHHA